MYEEKLDLRLVKLAETIAPANDFSFAWHKAYVIETYARVITAPMQQVSEFKVHNWFTENIDKHFPGANFITIPTKDECKPDFAFEWLGNIYIVEIKKTAFTRASLRQIKDYLDVFGIEKGIAIGASLSCTLPSNIQFIKHPLKIK